MCFKIMNIEAKKYIYKVNQRIIINYSSKFFIYLNLFLQSKKKIVHGKSSIST